MAITTNDALIVTVNVVRTRIGDPSSNPRRGCLYVFNRANLPEKDR